MRIDRYTFADRPDACKTSERLDVMRRRAPIKSGNRSDSVKVEPVNKHTQRPEHSLLHGVEQ